MVQALDTALSSLQGNKGALLVALFLVYCLATVNTMIGGVVREWWTERRDTKRDRAGRFEAERIIHGWREDDSDEWKQINEEYHAATSGEQRKLNRDWREQTAVNIEYQDIQDWEKRNGWQPPQWPTWTPEQLALPGRHRFDDTMVVEAMPVSPGQGYSPAQLRALVTETGEFRAVYAPKELVGVGSRR